MLLEKLNKIINTNPAEGKKKLKKKPEICIQICILYMNLIFQTTIQYRAIPAVIKSAGFTGIPARFAKSRLLHSKQ